MTLRSSARPRATTRILSLVVAGVATASCSDSLDDADRIVLASIDRHGGTLLEDSRIGFTFRDARFDVLTDRGTFRYERTFRDALGRSVTEVLANDGVHVIVNGEEVPLDPDTRAQVEADVNSVVYFAFLPFRLRDPAVRLRDLGPDEVEGHPYHRIEVTFDQEGGGQDWDARFVHWIHAEDHTLDYFAYRYSRGEGGTRFRRAINPREVGGLLIQDWENFGAPAEVAALEEYPTLLESGALNLLSLIVLEDVQVTRAGDIAAPVSPDAMAPAPAPDDGLELAMGVDRLTYAPGAGIEVVIRLANLSEEVRTLEFPTSQRFELLLLDQEGTERHRWSEGQAFLQVVGTEVLAPGEEVLFDAVISAPETAGAWNLQVRIPSPEVELRSTIPIEVVP